jgi:HK97 family phage portal protein
MAYWSEVSTQLNRAQRQAQYVTTIAGSYAGGPVSDPDPSLYANQARLMQQLSWVYSAISLVSQSAASLAQFQVMQLRAETKKPIVNHEFEQLLRAPNRYQFDSQFDFFEALFGFLKLSGNCYLYLNALSPTLPPAEIYILRPDRVMVVPDRQTFVRGYVFNVDGAELVFERDEIVHIKAWHPLNDWYGLTAIEALSLAAETDLKEAGWNKNFFDKQFAKPQGALAYADMINDSDWDKLKIESKEEYGGTQRRLMMLRGAGKGGVQWLQMGLSQKDMEFITGRQFNKEEIYQGLAPGLLQMLDKNSTEANSIAGEKVFREYTLYPLLKRVQEKFTAKILPRYGDDSADGSGLVGEFEEIRARDRVLDMQERQAFERVHTVAEVRAKYDNDGPLGDERDELLVAQAQSFNPNAGALIAGQGMDANVANTMPPQNPSVRNAENADQAGDAIDKNAAKPEAKATNQTGVMVAFALPTGAALTLHQLAQDTFGENAEITPADEMHITLAYFGDADTVNCSRETLTALVRAFAAEHSPINGMVGGVGRFTNAEADGRSAVYASFDSPMLPRLQRDLMDLLDGAGVSVDKSHGFTPHITLAYADADFDLAQLQMPRTQITFDAVTLAWAGEWSAFALGAIPMLVPSSGVMNEEQKMFVSDLAAWERKALKRLREKGRIDDALEFTSETLAPALLQSIRGALEAATNAVEVKAIFQNAREWQFYP